MTYDGLWRQLAAVYDPDEAKAIVRYVLDVRFGMSSTDVYCGKVTQLSADDTHLLGEIMRRLMLAEPVQYVLGEACFCGREFGVGPGVLIPRPETEDLCLWVEQWFAAVRQTGTASAEPRHAILDIGTGSGCIAVTLALDVPGADVTAWDISAEALRTAADNARRWGAAADFRRNDALCPPHDNGVWDAVVSNPPYVCLNERTAMERNVLEYEPEKALFVPDDDPLMFYRAIAAYAAEALRPGGALFFEINPAFANGMCDMLRAAGFTDVELREDRFGKLRFTKSTLPET